MNLDGKPLLVPLEREYRKGHENDPQYSGILPMLKWVVFYRTYDGDVLANYFVQEHKARDFAQAQNFREYLLENGEIQ